MKSRAGGASRAPVLVELCTSKILELSPCSSNAGATREDAAEAQARFAIQQAAQTAKAAVELHWVCNAARGNAAVPLNTRIERLNETRAMRPNRSFRARSARSWLLTAHAVARRDLRDLARLKRIPEQP